MKGSPAIAQPSVSHEPLSSRLLAESSPFPHPMSYLARPAAVLCWLLVLTATHWPGEDLPVGPEFDMDFMHADKFVHASMFAILTVVLLAARPLGSKVRWTTNLAVTFLGMAIYAGLDEYTQSFVDRTTDPMDWLADMLGVSSMCAAAVLSHPLRHELGLPRWPQAESLSALESSGQRSREFVGSALIVAVLTVISRAAGLVRDSMIAYGFGLGPLTDAFFIGFLAPDFFRRLFTEGSLTATFIPVYSDLLAKDKNAARRLALFCVLLAAIVTGMITWGCSHALAVAQASQTWTPDSILTFELTRTMLAYVPLVCVAAVLGAILQVHGRFETPALAPIALNVIMIAALVFGTWDLRHDGPNAAWLERVAAVRLVAGSVVFAGVAQVLLLFSDTLSLDPYRLGIRGAGSALRSIVLRTLPSVLGLAVLQINTVVDSAMAMALTAVPGHDAPLQVLGYSIPLPIQGQGTVGAIKLAQRLYEFPLGVFSMALATAIFPALAHAASQDAADPTRPKFTRILRHGLRLTIFIALPASVGLVLVGQPLAQIIFQRGQFSLADTHRVTELLIAYASAVWAYSLTHILVRAAYALGDTRSPLIASIVGLLLNVVLNVVLVFPLGAAGLAWSTAICGVVQTGMLLISLKQRGARPVDGQTWAAWCRSGLLTAMMAGALLAIRLAVPMDQLTPVQCAAVLAGMVLTGLVVVLCGAMVLKMDELRWLLRRKVE